MCVGVLRSIGARVQVVMARGDANVRMHPCVQQVCLCTIRQAKKINDDISITTPSEC